jgi:tetratricopeptide (TPR) repeat protein
VAARARAALLRMDVAQAAEPGAPPLFDADREPLLEGVGDQEALDLAAPPWPELARRAREALEAAAPQDRPWLLWRAAELSAEVEPGTRLEWTGGGLRADPAPALEMGLRYTRAQLLLALERTQDAAAELRRVMDSPAAGDAAVAARYAMAEIQRQERRYAAAGELYRDYARAFPHSQRGQRALLLAGDMALYGGAVDEAAEIYASILDRYGEGNYADDAAYRLGTAQLRRGRLEAARARFLPLAARGSGSRYAGRALLKLAELESQAGRDSQAVEALERLVEVDPDLAAEEDAPVRLARLELDRGRAKEALGWLDRAAGEPTAATLALRVEAQARAGRRDQARETLERLDQGYPEAGELVAIARCDLADAQLEAGRAEDALAGYRGAEQEARTAAVRARALYGAAMSAMRLERFDESKEAFAAAAAAAPGSDWSAQALFKVAGIATRQGRDEEAKQAYEELVETAPDHQLVPEALKGLAAAWRRLSRFDKALEIYHRLLEEHPEVEDASQILGSIAYCYHELGRYEVSIAAYERAMPLLDEEEQAYGQFWIADSLEKLGRLEEAAAAYLKIPYLYPESGQLPVTAQLKAAGVYEQMGQTEAAVRLYEKVLRAHGAQSQWGGEAARRLQRLQGGGDGGS